LPHPASKVTSFFHPSAEWLISIDLKRQVTLVSLRDLLRSEPLRARVIFEQCFDLYERSFPDVNEISTSQEIVAALQSEDLHFDVVALIEGGRVLGARHLILLDTGAPELGPFVVGEHLYVDRTERRRGIGKSLVSRTEDLMRSWGVRVAISEQNDPHAMSPDLLALDELAGISATQRRSFWKIRGYEGIDAPYVMPPISDDKEAVYHLRIAIRRLDPTFPDTIPTETFIGMLRPYHASWVGDVDSNPHTVALYARLRNEYPESVRIVDLDARRSCLSQSPS
jgi:GNAT superfamily N-acetyltransferase